MLELAVCAEYQISHSHFLGGPPEWTVHDRNKAIMWHIRQKETCPNCNTREREWNPEMGGDRQAYGVETYRCRGCEVKAMFPEDELEKMGKGVYLYLEKNDVRRARNQAQHER
jgi:flavoprotein